MRTALHSILSGSGAQFREITGWEVPESFGNPQAEYWALRRAAGIANLSPRAKLAVTGGDHVLFLHRMLGNEVKSLQPGKQVTAEGIPLEVGTLPFPRG
jgi:glycine cleavage system aminomethyltransferase T